VYDLFFFSSRPLNLFVWTIMFLFILNRNLGGNALDGCISRQILMRLLGSFLNDYRFSWFRFLFFVFGFVCDPVNKSRQKIKIKNLKYTQVKRCIYNKSDLFSLAAGNCATISFNGNCLHGLRPWFPRRSLKRNH